MKKWEFAVLVGFFAIFIILFLSVKPPWEAEASKPFDLDTDHDGVRDSKDSNPHYPGIFTTPQQKLEEYDYLYHNMSYNQYYIKDIRIPDKSISSGKVDREYVVGYAAYRFYYNYEINANYFQVLDFFLENMIRDGWRTRSEADEFMGDNYGLRGMSMYYSKKGDQDEYVTIVVIGQEYVQPYTQFTIIRDVVD